MNIEETKEAIRIMQAFVDGKDLEVLDPVGKWEPVHFPRWGWDDTDYRIKPNPTFRPWTSDEVPLGAWMRVKSDPKFRWLILNVGHDDMRREFFLQNEYSTDGGKTWLPCGVMEEAK